MFRNQQAGDCENSSAFLAEAVRLKLQQDHLDKACCMAIKNMRCLDNHMAQQMSAFYKEKEQKRSEDKEKLNGIIISTLQSLKELKDGIRNEDKLRTLDIELYKKSLLELQNKIRNIKETSDESLQRLSEEENILSNEIKHLENKIDEWNQPVNSSVLKPIVRSVSKSFVSNTENTRQEVIDFQKFLQNHGGHTGGWSEEDHILFLRLRNKSKGKISFLSLLRQHLPDISADEMLLHEEWYQQYESLKEKQKEAIKEWKASKSSSNKKENTVSEIGERHQNRGTSTEHAEQKKQKILEWKRTLQLKKELEDKKQWEDKQKELERERKKREKQELKKAEVERYKEEKLNERHTKMVLKQLKELQELEQRAAQATVLMKGFRKQDKLFVTRQLNRREQNILKEEQKLKHIQAMKEKTDVERDPNRLLQSTAAWRERCKQNVKPEISSVAMSHLHLRNMPHLHVPNWRRDVI